MLIRLAKVPQNHSKGLGLVQLIVSLAIAAIVILGFGRVMISVFRQQQTLHEVATFEVVKLNLKALLRECTYRFEDANGRTLTFDNEDGTSPYSKAIHQITREGNVILLEGQELADGLSVTSIDITDTLVPVQKVKFGLNDYNRYHVRLNFIVEDNEGNSKSMEPPLFLAITTDVSDRIICASDCPSQGIPYVVHTGSFHTCAVHSGTVKCWGQNQYGQLGNGSTTQETSPIDLPNSDGFSTFFADAYSTCIVKNNQLKCTGMRYGSAADVAAKATYTSLQNVPGISSVLSFAASTINACVIQKNKVRCWGADGRGQLGNDPAASSETPVLIDFDRAPNCFTSITLSGGGPCAAFDGEVQCWGNDHYGYLGQGTRDANRHPSPTEVDFSSKVKALSNGLYHNCALLDSGDVECWGNYSFGQLGDNNISGTLSKTELKVPTPVTTLSGVSDLSRGHSFAHTCAIQAGAAYCWGRNDFGQLGNNSTLDSAAPVLVSGLDSGVTEIHTGWGHTCALHLGDVKCWGSNSDGQLGDGTTTPSTTPVTVSFSTN